MPSLYSAGSTCNNASSSTSSKSFNSTSCSTSTAAVLPRSSSSVTRKGVYVAISICVVEIAYKLALVPLLLGDVTLIMCLLLLCLFPLGVVVGFGFNLPILCLPYLLYNFLWMLVYGVSAVFFLYELVDMNRDYQHFVESLLNAFYTHQTSRPMTATIRNMESVVYILTLVVLFVSIFGSLLALNIQNVVHQAYFHKKASIRAAKHIQAAVHLAEKRQQESSGYTDAYYHYATTTISTIGSPRLTAVSGGGVASPAGWAGVPTYSTLQTARMEEQISPTVSLV